MAGTRGGGQWKSHQSSHVDVNNTAEATCPGATSLETPDCYRSRYRFLLHSAFCAAVGVMVDAAGCRSPAQQKTPAHHRAKSIRSYKNHCQRVLRSCWYEGVTRGESSLQLARFTTMPDSPPVLILGRSIGEMAVES
jgi:hypothetical protein